MRDFRPGRQIQTVLLTVPLVVLIAWLVFGAIRRSQGPLPASGMQNPRPAATPGQSVLPASAAETDRLGVALTKLALPSPEADLPAEKLEDRVDGAADYLRGLGCRRLMAWKLASPPADLELMVFDRSEGAVAALTRDAGKERESGPGDEASVSDQAILFRRGSYYARLLADPAVPPEPGQLMKIAANLDRAIATVAAAKDM